MQGTELPGAGTIFSDTVVLGVIAHEPTHAVVLQILVAPYDSRWFPRYETSTLASSPLVWAVD